MNCQLVLLVADHLLGSDFNTTTQTATIIAGINRSIVNVSVTDDNIVEGNETFNMSLTVPSSLGPGVTTGDITSATATIIDTTSKIYCYMQLFIS